MASFLHDDQHYSQRLYFGQVKPRKRYGIMRFLFDCFMVAITSGFWLIWIFIREMRKR